MDYPDKIIEKLKVFMEDKYSLQDQENKASDHISKRPLILLALFLMSLYVLSMYIIHERLYENSVQEKLVDLNNHLIFQESLRDYVSTEMKPVIYQLQNQGIISQDFFDPRILSSTYIVRQVFANYAQSLDAKKIRHWNYRLASDNATNPINNANPAELALLQKFNEDRNLTLFKEVRQQEGKDVLYVAMPIKATETKCLRCHSTPEIAPKELVKKYGYERGFDEEVGHIRALLSYEYPYEKNQDHERAFIGVAVVILIFAVLVFFFIAKVYTLQEKEHLLIKRQKSALDYMAHHDVLTRLYNRQYLNQRLPEIIESLSQKTLWVVMFDIDHFKTINDCYGHNIGDKALKALADILQETTLEQDHMAVYRLGGEEFIMTLLEVDKAFVQNVYETIQIRLNLLTVENMNHKMTISAGAIQYKKGDNQSDLLKRCDDCLYIAKQQGRNRIVFDDELNSAKSI